MRNERSPISVIVMAIAVLTVTCTLAAQDSDLTVTAGKFTDAFGQGKATAMRISKDLLRDSGLSYQESLAAPQEGVVDCKDPREQLQVLTGIYWHDIGYAGLFGKADKAMATREFVLKEVVERLAVRPKLHIEAGSTELWRKYVENPGDEANRDALYKVASTEIEALIESAAKDRDVMDFLVDRMYGATLEFIYVSCKLSLGAPSTEKLIPIYNSIAVRMDEMTAILESIKDPKLQGLTKSKERTQLCVAVSGIIKKKNGNLSADDLRSILKLVEPVRDSYLKKCA